MYPHPSFEATPPGAAPGPPVKTGARVRHFRGCNHHWYAPWASFVLYLSLRHTLPCYACSRYADLSQRIFHQNPCGNMQGPLIRLEFASLKNAEQYHTHTHSPKRLAHPRSPMPPLSTLTARATHARLLLPAALASVPYGVVLVRVRVQLGAARGLACGVDGVKGTWRAERLSEERHVRAGRNRRSARAGIWRGRVVGCTWRAKRPGKGRDRQNTGAGVWHG